MTRTALFTVLVLTLAALPAAADEATDPDPTDGPAWLFLRQQVAVAGWPAGLLSDTRAEVRAPLHRSDSIVFQDTHAGAGGRLAVTPAFVEIGPRFTLAPIDVFDVAFQLSGLFYWPSSSGLLPYDDVTESTRDLDRKDRFRDEATRPKASFAFRASVAPTLKLKVGPVIALYAWDISYYAVRQPPGIDSRYVYEPFQDRLIAWNDLVIQHQPVLLFELMDGDDKPLLWIGGTFRDRMTVVSGDRSMVAGGLVMFKPGVKPGWPRIIVQVLPYVKDPDRVGGAPNMALALVWSRDFELRDAIAEPMAMIR